MLTPRARIENCSFKSNSPHLFPATDVPLFVTAGWFRLAADRYYVPISVAVPGASIPRANDKTTLDIAGFIRDERGAPVGRIRDTLTVPPASADTLAARQVLYQTGVTLPPGRFQAKVVVRENVSGQMGTFEAPILVPELKQSPVKVSSLVLGTQLQSVSGRRTRTRSCEMDSSSFRISRTSLIAVRRSTSITRCTSPPPRPVHCSCARACRSIAGR